MKYNKIFNLFLGTSLFMFGFLKFFEPFKNWFSVQISNSGLGELSYVMGMAGEMMVGITFLSLTKLRSTISFKSYALLSALASAGVIAIMSTAIYVHLQPNVPAEVLPLKIKPPFIPLSFLAIAIINMVGIWKQYKLE